MAKTKTKRVAVIMKDDKEEPRYKMISSTLTDAEREALPRQYLREAICQCIAILGLDTVGVKDAKGLCELIDRDDVEIDVALIIQQEKDDYDSIRNLEIIRGRCGDRVRVVGVAESIRCMEEMDALRVNKLFAAPLGDVDYKKVIEAVCNYGLGKE